MGHEPLHHRGKVQKRYIFGLNPVREAIKNNRAISLFIDKNRATSSFIQEILKSKTERLSVDYVDNHYLDNLSENLKNHQGIGAHVLPSPEIDLNGLLEKVKKKDSSTILMLDRVTDPQNFGAILRCAEATGVDAVIVEKRHSPAMNVVATYASAGASEILPIVKVSNIKNAIDKLKKLNFWVYAVEVTANNIFWDTKYENKIAFVFGSEGTGIRKTVIQICDEIVSVPMYGKISSLNVSATVALVLYEALRSRIS